MANEILEVERNSVSTSLLDSVKQGLDHTNWGLLHLHRPTIYRVPQSIRNVDPEAYEPKLISIGPYHRGKPALAAMEAIKWRYLNMFLSRNSSGGDCLEEYLTQMKMMEEQVRAAYWDKVEIEGDEFVRMMLLDGCFIVEFLLQWFLDPERFNESANKWEDPLKGMRQKRHNIVRDMMLLENQLPFFLIEKLFRFVYPNGNLESLMTLPLFVCFYDLILCPNEAASQTENFIAEVLDSYSENTTHHFLHLFHTLTVGKMQGNLSRKEENNNGRSIGEVTDLDTPFCVISILTGATPDSETREKLGLKLEGLITLLSYHVKQSTKDNGRIPSATQLQEAGIRFERKKNPKCIFDVSFNKGKMEIPQLHISDKTNSILRNLSAFEQCYPQLGYITSTYCLFLDFLVDTPEDASILQEEDIIVNHMGSNEAVTMLANRMSKGSTVFDFQSPDFGVIFSDVNEYASARVHTWRAKLRKDYFSSPWSIISVIAAVFLLILTVVQTVFGILPVVSSA